MWLSSGVVFDFGGEEAGGLLCSDSVPKAARASTSGKARTSE